MTRLRTGEPVLAPGTVVIPIEEIRLHSGGLSLGYGVYASKRPVAVVVCRRKETQSFDCDGDAVELGGLIEEVPDLREVLAECRERVRR